MNRHDPTLPRVSLNVDRCYRICVMANPLLAPLLRWFGRLSYPRLFALTAALFALNLFVLDPIPFIDEILLGLGTLLLANWKNRKGNTTAPIEGDPPRR